jgi:hypothetical protein
MKATIKFESGEEFTVEKDGDYFISETPFIAPDYFSKVTVEYGDTVEEYNGIFVEEDLDHSNGYRFTLSEMPSEMMDRVSLKRDNELLAEVIMELASIIGGEE